VPASYIYGRQDRVIARAYAEAAARDRLGTGLIEIGGGHSPFLARPAELARLLLEH
jgi:pimeloyl-ACP methyl ester carboxylesterase